MDLTQVRRSSDTDSNSCGRRQFLDCYASLVLNRSLLDSQPYVHRFSLDCYVCIHVKSVPIGSI